MGSPEPHPPASAPRRLALAVAGSLALAGTLGCGRGAGGTPAPDADALGGGPAGGALVAALAAGAAEGVRTDEDGGWAAPSAPRWPEDLSFHPRARAESIELDAVLTDEDGRTVSLVRRFERIALRRADDPAAGRGGDFGFADVGRLSGQLAVGRPDGAALVTRREALERMTLGLAGHDERTVQVRDAALALTVSPDGSCASSYRLVEGDGTALDFAQPACPSATAAGSLVVATGPTLGVAGTLVVDGRTRAVGGRGWVRRAWGEPPPPGGAVLFDRLVLELDGEGLLDAARSKRRSGRGPKNTTATWRASAGGDGPATTDSLGGVEWLDGEAAETVSGTASGDAVPARWHLRVATAGIDVVLEPVLDVPIVRDAFGTAWRGGVVASGSHTGLGFIEFAVIRDGSGDPLAARER